MICDLFSELLSRFDKDIEPGCKDKVELKDGGDWILVDQKLHKRGCVSEEQESILNKRKKQIEEIIVV